MHEDLWHSLLTWYTQYKRDLPWRHTRDPYAILVSETMLQQTGVERVIPKYLAFLDTFPTLQALADAPTADVIRLWSGLGYNRRAVWLQKAARSACEQWGSLPSSVEDLLTLPGIGPYTARAVACFAFNVEVGAFDTNIRRVLTRVLHGAEETHLTEKQMLALTETVLPPGRAYDWNQALMDLGATICTHDAPRRLICPLQTLCKAFPAVQTATNAQPAVIAEAKPKWKESAFVGSRRYYRGRVVESLRRLEQGQTMLLSDLGLVVKRDFVDDDLAWLQRLIEELATDGLVRIEGNQVALPI